MGRYSTAHVYVNRKTRIKRAKNRMQLRIKKNRARQKIARARTTLRHEPHQYVGGSPFVFLLLAVYCLKE